MPLLSARSLQTDSFREHQQRTIFMHRLKPHHPQYSDVQRRGEREAETVEYEDMTEELAEILSTHAVKVKYHVETGMNIG